MLDPNRSQLLVVDVQERLVPAMAEPEAMLRNCQILLKAARELALPVTLSEQYPKGLGATHAQLVDLVGANERFEKVEFSCLRDARLRERIEKCGRSQLVIGGIEAHVCVLQSSVEARQAGFEVYVAADAVASRMGANKSLALQRMERLGVEIIATEMAIFEWLGNAVSPAFKTLSKLIR